MGWGRKDLNTDHHRTSAIWKQRCLLVSRESFDDTLTLDFSYKAEADGFCCVSCSQGLMIYHDGVLDSGPAAFSVKSVNLHRV